ncbi:MAG: hypothetical protein CME61_04465 [Halobacteriovoraceae bacterium]|nr:hypothetical protein [Halobacteriovoraceae bacterium]|tara:strand:- start:22 stop:408 length:387 start_codon:yes stop_codon:yes gene_type:complete
MIFNRKKKLSDVKRELNKKHNLCKKILQDFEKLADDMVIICVHTKKLNGECDCGGCEFEFKNYLEYKEAMKVAQDKIQQLDSECLELTRQKFCLEYIDRTWVVEWDKVKAALSRFISGLFARVRSWGR